LRALLSAHDRTSAASSSQDYTLPSQPAAMLCISLPAEGGQSGFIYLAAQELPDQAAIFTYFDNAGREVSVLPCPDFDGFLTSKSLQMRQVSFVNNLPGYIIPMGCQTLEENTYSNEAGPNLSWLPHSPLVSSRSLLSRNGTPNVCPTNVASRAVGTQAPCPYLADMSNCPDPDKIVIPNAPFFFSMGGSASVGNYSPFTMSNITSL
jgi:hypothetical protein